MYTSNVTGKYLRYIFVQLYTYEKIGERGDEGEIVTLAHRMKSRYTVAGSSSLFCSR